MNTDYVDMLEEDDDLDGKTRFTYKSPRKMRCL